MFTGEISKTKVGFDKKYFYSIVETLFMQEDSRTATLTWENGRIATTNDIDVIRTLIYEEPESIKIENDRFAATVYVKGVLESTDKTYLMLNVFGDDANMLYHVDSSYRCDLTFLRKAAKVLYPACDKKICAKVYDDYTYISEIEAMTLSPTTVSSGFVEGFYNGYFVRAEVKDGKRTVWTNGDKNFLKHIFELMGCSDRSVNEVAIGIPTKKVRQYYRVEKQDSAKIIDLLVKHGFEPTLKDLEELGSCISMSEEQFRDSAEFFSDYTYEYNEDADTLTVHPNTIGYVTMHNASGLTDAQIINRLEMI